MFETKWDLTVHRITITLLKISFLKKRLGLIGEDDDFLKKIFFY